MILNETNCYVDPDSGAVFIKRTPENKINVLESKIATLEDRVASLEIIIKELRGDVSD